MKKLLLVVVLLLLPAFAHAQTPVVPGPTTRLAWDHDGVNTDTYQIKVDGAVLVTMAYADARQDTPGSYSTPFPPLTPGNHTLIVSACNAAGCGDSDPFDVRVVVIPAKPLNIRIVPGG